MSSGYTLHEIETQADAWIGAHKTLLENQAEITRLWEQGLYRGMGWCAICPFCNGRLITGRHKNP